MGRRLEEKRNEVPWQKRGHRYSLSVIQTLPALPCRPRKVSCALCDRWPANPVACACRGPPVFSSVFAKGKGFWNDSPVFLHLLSGISGPHAPMLERDPFTFPDTCVGSLWASPMRKVRTERWNCAYVRHGRYLAVLKLLFVLRKTYALLVRSKK